MSLLLPLSAAAQEAKQAMLELNHPYVRAMIAGTEIGAGYLTIDNKGSAPDRLIGVSTERAGLVEIHEMSVTDGTMKMRKLTKPLEIGPGQSLALEPGGYHLMFKKVAKPFMQGEKIEVTLTFEKAGPIKAEFTAEAASAGAQKSMSGMSMPAKP